MDLIRFVKHLAVPDWAVRRAFPVNLGDLVTEAVRRLERAHDVELRVVAEGGMPLDALLRGQSSRDRAIELFSRLRVWDTAQNTGVLIYVQFIDRKIEIVADRGISTKVQQAEWDAVCAQIVEEFRAGRYEDGARAGIAGVTVLLDKYIAPPPEDDRDELPDRPLVL